MTKDQYAQLFQYMETQFTALGERMDGMQGDIRRLETNVHRDIARLDEKIDGVEERLTARIDGVEQRLDGIEISQNEILNVIGERFGQHEAWIEQLAEATGTELRTAA